MLLTTRDTTRDIVRDRRDAGFTLIELLVATMILGVIISALAAAIIGVLRNTNDTGDRLALSHDAQISAAFFARDVASVGLRTYNATGADFTASIQPDGAAFACGTTTVPASIVRIWGDDWDNSQDPPVVQTDSVSYYLVPLPGTQLSELHRVKCLNSGSPGSDAPSGTAGSDAVLAHNVYTGPAPSDPADLRRAPTLTCSTTCGGTAGTPVPQQVTLTLWVGATRDDAYQITLTGQRRQTV
jgi:prepilin-type N-terminal cleavage/methylation domain-containing protein